MDREQKLIIRTVVLLGILGASGLGVAGCLYHSHWSQQRTREHSIARFSDAEQKAASGVVLVRAQSYPVAKGSPLWRQLVAAVDRALKTGSGPVSYYHRTEVATVFVLVSDRGERLCEVWIEDEFVQVDEFDAILTDIDLNAITWSHLLPQ